MNSKNLKYKIIIIYLIAINIIGIIVNIADKQKAKHGKWRIPEATLWAIALLGGSVGSYATMKTIRHKTKHKSFMIGFPLIIVFQFAIITFILFKTEFGSF